MEGPKRNKRRAKDSKLQFSTDVNSKHLKQYLSLVLNGIDEAANKIKYTIHEDDKQWLADHEGRFECFAGNDRTTSGQEQYSHYFHKETGNISVEQAKEKALKIKHTHVMDSPRFEGLACATAWNYERIMRSFWNFLAIKGDYNSMLLLLRNHSSTCPSTNSHSVAHFVFHKFHAPGTKLTSNGLESGKPVYDAFGNQILTQGSIQNYEALNGFFAALALLHLKIGQKKTQYRDHCDACLANFVNDPKSPKPCSDHLYDGVGFLFKCKGNPLTSTTVEKARQWLKNEATLRGYQADSRTPFFPHDIDNFQRHVDSHNFDLCELRNYLMVLSAIHTASRFDEYHSIDFSHFEMYNEHWIVSSDNVKQLVQGVKGKSDDDWFRYSIEFDDFYPKRCYLRHLLVYVHCLNLQGGFLFPSDKEIKEHFDSSHPITWTATTALHASDFQEWLFQRRDNNCIHTEYTNWGNHSPRHTKYLFAILGGGDPLAVQRNARHSSSDTALKYLQDAMYLLNLCLSHPELMELHGVSPFKDVLLHRKGTNAMRMTQFVNDRQASFWSLQAAAQHFVINKLGVRATDSIYRNPAALLRRSYSLRLLNVQPEDHLRKFIDGLPAGFKESAFAHFGTYMQYKDRVVKELEHQITELRSQVSSSKFDASYATLDSPTTFITPNPTPKQIPSPAGKSSDYPRYTLGTNVTPAFKSPISVAPDNRAAVLCQVENLKKKLNLAEEVGITKEFKNPRSPHPPSLNPLQQATAGVFARYYREQAQETNQLSTRMNSYLSVTTVRVAGSPDFNELKFQLAFLQRRLSEAKSAHNKVDILARVSTEFVDASEDKSSSHVIRYNLTRQRIYSGSNKSFLSRTLDPFVKCFYDCHNANLSSFLHALNIDIHNGTLKHSSLHLLVKQHCVTCRDKAPSNRKRKKPGEHT